MSAREVEVKGDRATATPADAPVPPDEPLELQRKDGDWRIAALPKRSATATDPAESCVAGGLAAFDGPGVEPFWKREGRKDFKGFLTRGCRRASKQGVLDQSSGMPSAQELQPIMGRVILEMVREGKIRDPR